MIWVLMSFITWMTYNFKEHLYHLNELLHRMKEFGITLILKISQFAVEEI